MARISLSDCDASPPDRAGGTGAGDSATDRPPGPFAIVAGDLVLWGGMDRPNYELAWHQAERLGAKVHLVSHQVAPPLATHPNVVWHRVARPWGRHAAGAPFLSRRGHQVSARVAQAGGTVIVNGGNCLWGDVNWIHYVHNAPTPRGGGLPHRRAWSWWRGRVDRRRERLAIAAARLIITDSDLVRDRLIAGGSVDPSRVRTIYYGVDSETFRSPTSSERTAARQALGLPLDCPIAVFVGALGHDRRKGFDVLFDAWCRCAAGGDWNAVLVAAGTGSELPYWRARAAEAGSAAGIRLLGFIQSVPTLLAAADVLISPTRFEPYGQGVHEALCCGIPAFVTRCAGIAERYPVDLHDLLLDDPPTADQLSDRLRAWRTDMAGYRARIAGFAQVLRQRSWADMATEMMAVIAEARSWSRPDPRLGARRRSDPPATRTGGQSAS